MNSHHDKTTPTVQRPVFQSRATEEMQNGINVMVEAIKPTLGPMPRLVAMSQVSSSKTPELLDKGALIARRIIELPEHNRATGAICLSHTLWQLYEAVGDGTATAALLFQEIYCQGLKHLAAGGNAVHLAHYLNEGLDLITHMLGVMAVPISGETQFAQLALSICHDPALASILGEIFDVIGEYGQLDIRAGKRRATDRKYVEGMYWNSGAVSRQMLSGGDEPDHVGMPEAAILLSDLDFDDVRPLAAALEVSMQAGIRFFLLLGTTFSENVIDFLLANTEPENFRVIAVQLPGSSAAEQMANLQDLAVLTGGIPLYKAAGDQLKNLTPNHWGHARRVWVNRTMFGIVSGTHNARALRSHIHNLRHRLEHAADKKERELLEMRLGKLLGDAATLHVGGDSETEIETRKARAKETDKVLRDAVQGGVLPGGGAALLGCQPILFEQSVAAQDPDERAAYHILHSALEAPLRCICANAGYDETTIARLRLAGMGYCVDAHTGEIVSAITHGILDAAHVVRAAVHYAVTSAAQALTLGCSYRERPHR